MLMLAAFDVDAMRKGAMDDLPDLVAAAIVSRWPTRVGPVTFSPCALEVDVMAALMVFGLLMVFPTCHRAHLGSLDFFLSG
jgi:hypothetical protein